MTMNNYKEKSAVYTKIEDVDKKQGIVIFYTSVFDVKDSDGDIIQKGAFKKSLSEGFQRFRHLKDHRISIGLPIKNETFEDDYGLRVGSKLFLGKQDADETLVEYETYAELGNAMEHSFGYQTIKEEFSKEKDANLLKELKLWEFTTMTTWGANHYARQVGLKDLNRDDLLIQLNVLNNMIKGDFKDDKLYQYEMQLNQIKKMLEFEPSTLKEPAHSNDNELKEFLTKILGK